MFHHPSVAFYVSSHGFGHAARTCAVIESLQRTAPDVRAHILSETPVWFFEDSLDGEFTYHPIRTDVGMIQQSAIVEDVPATIRALEGFLPVDGGLIEQQGRFLRDLSIQMVVCDISPLGIAIAHSIDLPSILIENFTWDWIYRGYADRWPEFLPFIDLLEEIYSTVDLRIQVEPCCQELASAFQTPSLSRNPRQGREATRNRLEISCNRPLVLVTMGGIAWDYRFFDHLRSADSFVFVVPGGAGEPRREGNMILLPFQTGLHHADLVHAADLVVGKLGYSTVAEVRRSGPPLLYLTRPEFPESAILENYVLREIPCRRIDVSEFASGAWVSWVETMVGQRSHTATPDDAGLLIADRILDYL